MAFRVEVACIFTDQDAIYGLANPPAGGFTIKIGDAVGATAAADVAEMSETLRGRIEDHLQAHDPDFLVYQGAGNTYSIEKDDAFTLHFNYFQSFAEFLGMPTTSTGSVTTITGDPAPSIFVGARSAVVTTGWRWQRRRTETAHGECRSVKLLRQQIYRVQLQVTRDEIHRWHKTQRYMLLGLPFTLFTEKDAASTNGFNSNGYAQGRLGGKIYMRLDASQTTITEAQLTDPYQSDITVEFTGIDVTTSGGALSLS